MTQETEVKIPIGERGITLDDARARIEPLGFTPHKPRVFERNLVFDLPNASLRESRQLLRLREAGGHSTLTYKGGPATGGKHKAREERETSVGNFEEMSVILERLGYSITFIYEKYRTEYSKGDEPGTITVDETPIGNFLELEGEPAWIDATAKLLGFAESDYLTSSYGAIYVDWCRKNGIAPANMQFPTT